MHILVQLSIFDLRFLQGVDSLVYPLRTWPHVERGYTFLNHFGPIQEVPQQKLTDNILPADRLFIECKRSLKFEALNSPESPCKISCRQRNLFLDGKGGVRLRIGLQLHLGRHNPFSHVDEAIQYALQQKLLIKSPEKVTKSLRLSELTASFKNLYFDSATSTESPKTDRHLIRQQRPVIWVNLSSRERKVMQLDGYQAYHHPDQEAIYYKQYTLPKHQVPAFVLPKSAENENLSPGYCLSKIISMAENLASLQSYPVSKAPLFPPAVAEKTALYQQLFEGKIQADWQPFLHTYQQIAGPELASLQSTIATVSQTGFRHQVSGLIARGEISQALDLLQAQTENSTLADQQTLIILNARYNQMQRDAMNGTLSQKDLDIVFNTICAALLSLLDQIAGPTSPPA